MDRHREQLREEVFELDPHEQALLAEEITEHLSKDKNMKLWLEEGEKRMAAFHRGEMKAIDSDVVMANARKKIQQASKRR
jgi:hypothetical protein